MLRYPTTTVDQQSMSSDISDLSELPEPQKPSWILLASLTVTTLIYLAMPITAWALRTFDLSLATQSALVPIGFGVFFAVYVVTVVGMAYSKRDQQPFRARCFILLLMSATSGFVLTGWVFVIENLIARDIASPSDTVCRVTEWLLAVTFPGATIPYFLRCYRLYKIFKWYNRDAMIVDAPAKVQASFLAHVSQVHPAAVQDRMSSLDGLSNSQSNVEASMLLSPSQSFAEFNSTISQSIWDRKQQEHNTIDGDLYIPRNDTSTFNTPHKKPTTRHTGGLGGSPGRGAIRGYTTRTLVLWYMQCLVPVIVICLFWSSFGVELIPSLPVCSKLYHSVSNLFFVVYTILESIGLLMAISVIANVWDEFNIRWELGSIVCANLLIIVVQLTGYTDGNHILICLKCYILLVVSIVTPLVATYTWTDNTALLLPPTQLKNMEGVLTNEASYDAFAQFLFHEPDGIGSELLSFYVRSSVFEDLSDADIVEMFEDDEHGEAVLVEDGRLYLARGIYQECLLPSSDFIERRTSALDTKDASPAGNSLETSLLGINGTGNSVYQSSQQTRQKRLATKDVARDGLWRLFPRELVHQVGMTLQQHDEARMSNLSTDSDYNPYPFNPSHIQPQPLSARLFERLKIHALGVLKDTYFLRFTQSSFYKKLRSQAVVDDDIQRNLLQSEML